MSGNKLSEMDVGFGYHEQHFSADNSVVHERKPEKDANPVGIGKGVVVECFFECM